MGRGVLHCGCGVGGWFGVGSNTCLEVGVAGVGVCLV